MQNAIQSPAKRPYNAPERRLSALRRLQAIATERGGKLISEAYLGDKTRHTWECSEGHQWQQLPKRVSERGSWCPACFSNPTYTIQDMHQWAANRDGHCLSYIYKGAHKPLMWECHEGHQWSQKPMKIREGKWCRECARLNTSHGERIARDILEAMFQAKFPSTRPSWLVGIKGARLELDGYNEHLAIAFEYQGLQHYQPTGRYTAAMVAAQQLRDEHKARLCHARGVRLIVIPHFTDHWDRKGCTQQVEFAVIWAGLVVPRRSVRKQ